MDKILIATKNKGKAIEFNHFFAAHHIHTFSLLDLSEEIKDIEETGSTFAENAKLKAEQISAVFNVPVLADDSGLIIDALDGRPGIFSARYAGLTATDQENIDKVLAELKDIPPEQRTARFVCVLAVARPRAATIFVTGYCAGSISLSAMGTNGFGYDPIFIPEGYTKTMAQLTAEEKAQISHRGQAIIQLDDQMDRLILG